MPPGRMPSDQIPTNYKLISQMLFKQILIEHFLSKLVDSTRTSLLPKIIFTNTQILQLFMNNIKTKLFTKVIKNAKQ
jgi:hypothetical protein